MQLYIPKSITLLKCQCRFLTMCSYYNSCFFKKDCSYRNNFGIRLHDGYLEHNFMKEQNACSYVFLPIFMFWPPRFSFRNPKDANSCMFLWCILQPAVYWFVPGMIWLSSSLYSKCTVFTVNICYLQVLAMYKKVAS